MDDNADHYRSFVLSDPEESTWSPPRSGVGGFFRDVGPPQGRRSGAKFALFVHHDDFEDPAFSLALEVAYRNPAGADCHLELNAGIANLRRVLTLGSTAGSDFSTDRLVVPRWIYAPLQEGETPDPRRPTAGNGGAPVDAEGAPASEETPPSAVPAHKRFGTGQIRIDHIRFLNEQGDESYVLRHGQPLDVILSYHAEDPALVGKPLVWAAGFARADGLLTEALVSTSDRPPFTIAEKGTLRLHVDTLLFGNGHYSFSSGLFGEFDLHGFNAHFTTSPHVYDFLARTVEFVVEGVHPAENWVFRQPVDWQVVG